MSRFAVQPRRDSPRSAEPRARSGSKCGVRVVGRVGGVFFQAIALMAATGTMLALSGIMLHSILRADRLADREMYQVRTLRRLDEALRSDFSNQQMKATISSPEKAILTLPDQERVIEWTVAPADSAVERQVRLAGRLTDVASFRFLPKTTIRFVPDSEAGIAICEISEVRRLPGQMARQDAATWDKINRNLNVPVYTVEIQLAASFVGAPE